MSNDQFLTFFIRAEEYAVGILRVREIIEYESVTRVPGLPSHVRGVINLRGSVLPVIDLAAKFGHEDAATTRTSCIVVVETRFDGETVVVGLVADAVSEVVEISEGAVEPPPSFGTGVRIDFLSGMGKLDSRIVLLLDIDRVFAAAEIQQTIDALVEADAAIA